MGCIMKDSWHGVYRGLMFETLDSSSVIGGYIGNVWMRDFGYRLHILEGRATVQNKLQGTCMLVCTPGSNPAPGLARGTAGRACESPGNSWCQRPAVNKMQIYDCRERGFLLSVEKTEFKTQVGSPACVSAACLICEDLWFDKLLKTFKTNSLSGKKSGLTLCTLVHFVVVVVCPNQCFFTVTW